MFAHSFSAFNNQLLREAIGGGANSSWLITLLIVVNTVMILSLSIYGAHRFVLMGRYLRSRKRQPQPKQVFAEAELPGVTVQLPVFNEELVIEDLIAAMARLDYPKDRLEIQVLDDSTDETTAIAERAAERWRREGVDIKVCRRAKREGFKAGALAEGLKHARHDLIAIFDADFRPRPDYLRQLVHHFSDEQVGVVQGRWGHSNYATNPLTWMQTLVWDGHFVLEQPARNRTGYFIQFNGTGGIWRRQAIVDGGGWQADTLTEDLDLSYRAQMKGWRFVYDPEAICPAELPADINAFKAQQHRWAKGSIQTMLKLLPDVFRSKEPLSRKIEAFFHLSANMIYLPGSIMLLLSLPMVMFRTSDLYGPLAMAVDGWSIVTGVLSVLIFFAMGQVRGGYRDLTRRLLAMPHAFAIGVGMLVNQAAAVIEALSGHQSPFVRTPKVGQSGVTLTGPVKSKGFKAIQPWLEMGIGAYYLAALIYPLMTKGWAMLPWVLFFAPLAGGFWYIGLGTLLEKRALRRALALGARTAPSPA